LRKLADLDHRRWNRIHIIPGDWHSGWHILKCIYKLYWPMISAFGRKLGRTKNDRKCNHHDACYDLVEQLSHCGWIALIHQWEASPHYASYDKIRNGSAAPLELDGWFIEWISGSQHTDELFRYHVQFLHISWLLKEWHWSIGHGHSEFLEHAQRWMIPILCQLGKRNYAKLFTVTTLDDLTRSAYLQDYYRLNRTVSRMGRDCHNSSLDELIEHTIWYVKSRSGPQTTLEAIQRYATLHSLARACLAVVLPSTALPSTSHYAPSNKEEVEMINKLFIDSGCWKPFVGRQIRDLWTEKWNGSSIIGHHIHHIILLSSPCQSHSYWLFR
jgi:hypothetical protein